MVYLQRDTRRILLIDANSFKANLRAAILRNYEIEVHTATTLPDAKSLWQNNLYDLILLAAAEDSPEAVALPLQIRKIKPRQRIGLLVGAPNYVREVGGIPKRVVRTDAPPPLSFTPPLVQMQSGMHWQEMIQRLIGS
jgi:response regulator RpfG family c-di-GMP phosphodiesterase